MNARTLAILDLVHQGYHPPAPDHPDHDALLATWNDRYRVRLACAERMLEAAAACDGSHTPEHEPEPEGIDDWTVNVLMGMDFDTANHSDEWDPDTLEAIMNMDTEPDPPDATNENEEREEAA